MALDLGAIREALASQIYQNTGREVHVYPYPTGGQLELPAVVIRSGEDYVDYHVTLGVGDNAADVNLILDIMARCAVALEDGLIVLDELLSSAAGHPTSVIDAIEADESLGGVVENVSLGVAGQQEGFGTQEEGRPHGVLSSVPLAVWVNRS